MAVRTVYLPASSLGTPSPPGGILGVNYFYSAICEI
jgi:hypothetical protein